MHVHVSPPPHDNETNRKPGQSWPNNPDPVAQSLAINPLQSADGPQTTQDVCSLLRARFNPLQSADGPQTWA